MATLTIPDEQFKQAGLTEREALMELACRLFDAGRLSLPAAATFAGVSRIEMEDALMDRKIAVYRPTPEDLARDLKNLREMGV
jgi:predicted HTH domain antitoxin